MSGITPVVVRVNDSASQPVDLPSYALTGKPEEMTQVRAVWYV